MENLIKLQNNLNNLYFFLRDEGFSIHAQSIKRLLVFLQKKELKQLKKEMKSAIISGGAGSIRDIDFKSQEKSILFREILRNIDDVISRF
jgi:hypothetical protein